MAQSEWLRWAPEFQNAVLEDWSPGATNPAGLGQTCPWGMSTALNARTTEACIQQGHRYTTEVDNDDVESFNRGYSAH